MNCRVYLCGGHILIKKKRESNYFVVSSLILVMGRDEFLRLVDQKVAEFLYYCYYLAFCFYTNRVNTCSVILIESF
jgi:hypothetical protein